LPLYHFSGTLFLMTKKDCVIDFGTAFTVEWYFDEKGYSQAYEYFLQTSKDQKLNRPGFAGDQIL